MLPAKVSAGSSSFSHHIVFRLHLNWAQCHRDIPLGLKAHLEHISFLIQCELCSLLCEVELIAIGCYHQAFLALVCLTRILLWPCCLALSKWWWADCKLSAKYSKSCTSYDTFNVVEPLVTAWCIRCCARHGRQQDHWTWVISFEAIWRSSYEGETLYDGWIPNKNT